MENYTEHIERYLGNQMDDAEKKAFEKALESNPQLKADTDIQRNLIKGIELSAARAEFDSAVRQRGLSLLAAKAALVLLAALVIAGAVYLLTSKTQKPVPETITVAQEPQQTIADSSTIPHIPEQVFSLRLSRDTVIETRSGIVFAIEAGTFNTESGTAQIHIREALKASDIVKAGLSTTSNGQWLETGGMFSIDASENGRILEMLKPIHARIPTDSFDAGMMLYNGIKDSNGLVNWVQPKPLTKPLQTVDIQTLDFYPPDYLKTLERLGLPYQDKAYTDSLYYALSGYKPPVKKKVSERKNVLMQNWWRNLLEYPNGQIEVRFREKGQNKSIMFKDRYAYSRFEDSIQRTLIVKRAIPEDKTPVEKRNFEIDPSRIKAIWNSKFNNTILATKAFEERLKFIFSTCQPRFLDLYVANLDKSLYEIDSMCAAVSGGSYKEKFLEFAKRRDGSVPLEKGINQKLNRYFETQYKAYRKAAEATRADLVKQQSEQKEAADKAVLKNALEALEKGQYSESEAFCRNLSQAYQTLGETVNCPKQTPPPARAYFGVVIPGSGTYNIDKPAMEIISVNSVPTYSLLELTINKYETFDRVMVYLVPKGLRSFIRMNLQVNGTFREKVNDFIPYDVIVVAYKGDELYFAKKQNTASGRQILEPAAVDAQTIEKLMEPYDFSGNDNKYTFALKGISETAGIKPDIKARIQQMKSEQAFEQILQSVFPCFDRGVKLDVKLK